MKVYSSLYAYKCVSIFQTNYIIPSLVFWILCGHLSMYVVCGMNIELKSFVFWDIVPCSPMKVCQPFFRNILPQSSGYIPQYGGHHNHWCENLKSCRILSYLCNISAVNKLFLLRISCPKPEVEYIVVASSQAGLWNICERIAITLIHW
jgi:hypothetical protein